VSRLLLAQEIAGATDIEIVRRKRETGAERVERLQNLEALLRALGQFLPRRRGDVSVSTRLRSPDAAAKLIELSKAEHVGAMHDQRVCVRHVEPRLDDRR